MPTFMGQALDLRGEGPIVALRLGVGSDVEDVLKQAGRPIPDPVVITAMLDTGSTHTVIRDDLPQRLDLDPVALTYMTTPAVANIPSYEYSVRLMFSNDVVVQTRAVAMPLVGGGVECLVGRDVLRFGVLVYIGPGNLFTLSF